MSADVLASWMEIVDREMKAIRNNIEGPEPSPAVAAYHCQQAAEKIVKVVLVAENLSFRKTHDIDELVQLLPVGHPLLSDLHALDRFTPFATAFRYPMDDPILEPSLAEVAAWHGAIEGARRKVAAFIAAARVGKGSSD